MSPIDHAESFLSGAPSPEAIAWVRSALMAHLDDDLPIGAALGLDGNTSRAYRRRQWLRHIEQAVAIVKTDHSTPFSLAKTLSAEMARQRRSHRVNSAFERHIAAAMAACPEAADNPDILRKYVRQVLGLGKRGNPSNDSKCLDATFKSSAHA